jgi:hypothetical protein
MGPEGDGTRIGRGQVDGKSLKRQSTYSNSSIAVNVDGAGNFGVDRESIAGYNCNLI